MRIRFVGREAQVLPELAFGAVEIPEASHPEVAELVVRLGVVRNPLRPLLEDGAQGLGVPDSQPRGHPVGRPIRRMGAQVRAQPGERLRATFL